MATNTKPITKKPAPKDPEKLKPGDKGYAALNRKYQEGNKRGAAAYVEANRKDFLKGGGTQPQWDAKVKASKMKAKAPAKRSK